VEAVFLRIVTHPRILRTPSSLQEAVEFLSAVQESLFRETPWTQRIRAQWRRWCEDLELKGDDVNDAFLAATAAGVPYRLVSRDGRLQPLLRA
jgi:hypothetical protein